MVKARRDDLLTDKIGPEDTGLVAVVGIMEEGDPFPPMPYAHIVRTPATEKIMQAHIDAYPEGLDVDTQWTIIKDVDGEHVFTAVLIVEFPAFEESFTLFFPFDYKHYAELLEMSVAAGGMGLVFPDQNKLEMLFCETPPHILSIALAAYREQAQEASNG